MLRSEGRSPSLHTCHISLGSSLTLPAPEAGELVELILLYSIVCNLCADVSA